MTKFVFEVEFVATFTRQIETEAEDEEAAEAQVQETLDNASLKDVYEGDDWNIDPYNFDKNITDQWEEIDEDEEAEA